MTPDTFVAALAAFDLPDVFNPYADTCSTQDVRDAADRRRQNLTNFLDAAITARADTIWIARDLGYRGGRRTGVPLTDDVHLAALSDIYAGIVVTRATAGPPVAERTAAITWQLLKRINRPVFLWNIFPLHPHERGDPFSNRCHTRHEREMFMPLLRCLLEMLQPREIVAIGRDAHSALTAAGIVSHAVRHPSYGGQPEFIQAISTMYSLAAPSAAVSPRLL